MCSKYHGHTHYYQATMLVIVINCVRLFVVAMAMVVIGDTCVRSITTIRTIIRLPEALSFIVAMVMIVMGGMCVQSIMAIHTITRLLHML